MTNLASILVACAAISTLVAALAIKAPAIEQGLSERADLALEGTGMHADVDGLNATLLGVAYSDAHQEKALIRLAALDGLEVLADHSVLPPPVTPYATSALRRADGVLVLEGSAPDKAAMKAVSALTDRLSTVKTVQNHLRVGIGAPEDWTQTFVDALVALEALAEGRVSVVDGLVTIDGIYKDEQAATAFAALNRPGWRVFVRLSPFADLERVSAENDALTSALSEARRRAKALAETRRADIQALALAEARVGALEAALKTVSRSQTERDQ